MRGRLHDPAILIQFYDCRSFGPKGTSHTGILRENQVVLLCIYNVNDPAHMVKMFGNTPHYMCP